MERFGAVARKRLALNEARARQLNSSRSEYWIEQREPAVFWCECGDPGCTALIQLTSPEWEAVRADPIAFVVAPGHVDPRMGETVSRAEGHWVVRKVGEPQEEVARRTDPSGQSSGAGRPNR